MLCDIHMAPRVLKTDFSIPSVSVPPPSQPRVGSVIDRCTLCVHTPA